MLDDLRKSIKDWNDARKADNLERWLAQHGPQTTSWMNQKLVNALAHTHLKTAAVALRHGANPDAGSYLFHAAENSNYAVVAFLADNKASLNDKYIGRTALMTAAENGDTKMARLLVEKGASLDERTLIVAGDTAEDIARQKGNTDIADLLKQARQDRAVVRTAKVVASQAPSR